MNLYDFLTTEAGDPITTEDGDEILFARLYDFDALKSIVGRIPIRRVTIHFKKCAEVYGVGNCQAGIVAQDTAQGGSTTYMTLAAGDAQADDYYNNMILKTTGGTGSGQEVTITDYANATNQASAVFPVAVDGTTTYTIHNVNSSAACYNARKHCQDFTNFNGTATLNVVICDHTVEPQYDIKAIPCIETVSTAHSEIAPGQNSIGKSAGISFKCIDFPHHDIGIDPYVGNRTYPPISQGTYFGKLKARNPYYQDALVTVETGYITDPYLPGAFKSRTYFLEKFDGPDKNGRVNFVCQDIMRRLDDKRSTCPVVTVGKLTAALALATTTNFTVDGDADKYATGGGAVRINDEVIEYANGVDNGDDTFTFSTLTRGADNTVAADHDQYDAVQMCVDFTAMKPADIAYALYNTYAGIPASYLNTTQWSTIADTWLQATFSRRITKPTGVKKLLGEAHQQMGFFTWWDEEKASVKLEAIRPTDYGSIQTYTEESHIMEGSFEVMEKTDLRLTEVSLYYEYKNPIDVEKPEDFKRRVRNIDLLAEGDDQYGDIRINEIFAAWIQDDNAAIATSSRIVKRFRDNIRVVKFDVDAKDESLTTGDQCYLQHSKIQDETGAAGATLFQIVQRDEIKSGERYSYRAWELFFSGRYAKIAPAGTPNYGSATDDQKNRYCWIASAGGGDFSDGGEAYKII